MQNQGDRRIKDSTQSVLRWVNKVMDRGRYPEHLRISRAWPVNT